MRAAEVLADVIGARYAQCPPGMWPTEDSLAEYLLEHLPKQGMAVVELPKPVRTPTWWNEECLGGWDSTLGDPISAWPSKDRGVALPDAKFISIDDARTLAAALLAAADAAEKVSA